MEIDPVVCMSVVSVLPNPNNVSHGQTMNKDPSKLSMSPLQTVFALGDDTEKKDVSLKRKRLVPGTELEPDSVEDVKMAPVTAANTTMASITVVDDDSEETEDDEPTKRRKLHDSGRKLEKEQKYEVKKKVVKKMPPVDWTLYQERVTYVLQHASAESRAQLEGSIITDFRMPKKLNALTQEELAFVQVSPCPDLPRLLEIAQRVGYVGLFAKYCCAKNGVNLGRFVNESGKTAQVAFKEIVVDGRMERCPIYHWLYRDNGEEDMMKRRIGKTVFVGFAPTNTDIGHRPTLTPFRVMMVDRCVQKRGLDLSVRFDIEEDVPMPMKRCKTEQPLEVSPTPALTPVSLAPSSLAPPSESLVPSDFRTKMIETLLKNERPKTQMEMDHELAIMKMLLHS